MASTQSTCGCSTRSATCAALPLRRPAQSASGRSRCSHQTCTPASPLGTSWLCRPGRWHRHESSPARDRFSGSACSSVLMGRG
eukprot:scaffold4448_cov115-Isochrysis_galbana.AAC.7